MSIKYLSLALILLLTATAAPAQKETGNDSLKHYIAPSVTVTTSKAVERETPAPFIEIDERQIKADYTMQDIPNFLNGMPSVLTCSQNGNPIGYNSLNMRGFDQRRISVMINGIPQNDPEDHNVYWIDFPDLAESLESIQIQRGSGAGGYGPAAIGGAINLVSSNFIDKKVLRIGTGVGWQEYSSNGTKLQPSVSKLLAEFSSGKIGDYAFYGRLSKVQTTGYRDRSFANLNSYFFSAVRFDEGLTSQLNIFGGPLRDGLVYYGVPKKWVKDRKLRRKNLGWWNYDNTGDTLAWAPDRREQEIEEFSQPHFELLNDWTIDENLVLKSALFYYMGDGYYDFDGSWCNAETLRMTPEYGFADSLEPGNALLRGFVGNKHGGWIPRLIYDHGGGSLTVGAEIRVHRSTHWGKVVFAENLPAEYDPDYKLYSYEGKRNILSIFAVERYRLGKRLILSAEAQLVRQSYGIGDEKAGDLYTQYLTTDGKTVGNGGDIFNVEYWFLNPRLGLNWNFNDEMNAYASLAYTSREPRMKNLYSAGDAYYKKTGPLFDGDTTADGTRRYNFSEPLVKPEKMFDIELGWAYRDEDYYISVNAYWMEFRDELVKSGKLDVFGSPVDGNAPRARHYGLELQGSAALTRGIAGIVVVSGNATASRNRIIEFDYETDGGSVSLEDNPVAGFPDFMANARLSYIYGGLYISLSGKYVGDFRTDNFGRLLTTNQALIDALVNEGDGEYYRDNKVDPYFTANANVSYEFRDVLSLQSLKLRFQVYNLLNRLYATSGEGRDFFPAAERSFYFGADLYF